MIVQDKENPVTFGRAVNRSLAVALIASMLPFAASASPKPVNPETIHRKVVQRGEGKWVRVEMKNGTEIVGRIASLEEQAFGVQPENYAEPAMIAYADVRHVKNAVPKGKMLALAFGVAGAGAATMMLVAQHQMNAMMAGQPTAPGPAAR